MQITSRQTVGDQSAITLQVVADQVPKCEVCSIISRRVMWQSGCRPNSATGRQTVGDRSANSRRPKLRTKILVGQIGRQMLIVVPNG